MVRPTRTWPRAWNNLASLYLKQKRYGDAAPYFERALQIRTTALGPENQLVTNGLDRLAGVYTAQEKLVEAEPLYKQSYTIHEKEALASLRNLATLYVARQKYAEADPLYKLALAIYDKDTPAVKKKISKKDVGKVEPPPPYLVETLEEYAGRAAQAEEEGRGFKAGVSCEAAAAASRTVEHADTSAVKTASDFTPPKCRPPSGRFF